MRILEQKTDLGKCVICTQKVSNDKEVWFNEASVMYKEKIICGVCLVNLVGASKEALADFDTDENMDSKERMMAQWGVYVDPETGKMVSKDIPKSESLNTITSCGKN